MKTNAIANQNNYHITDAALRRKIEERAYHIWLENGCGHGDHERHWFQAEKELMDAAKHEGKPQSDVRQKKRTSKPN